MIKKSIILLLFASLCFGSDTRLEQTLSEMSVGIESFGKDGIEQVDLFGDPVPRNWFTAQTRQSPSKYNHSLPKKFSFSDNPTYDLLSFQNPTDYRQVIVARHFDEQGNTMERFLIQIEPGDELNINLLKIRNGQLEFYSSLPFDATLSSLASLTTEELKSQAASLLGPTPASMCKNADERYLQFCFNHRTGGNPHCIWVFGEYSGSSVNASMHWFFTCPDGWRNPMYQFVEVFWPTDDDLYHEAISDKTPFYACNPGIFSTNAAREVWLENNNHSYTENSYDSTKQHKWTMVWNVAWRGWEGYVDCVGSFPCNGRFRYEKTMTCER